MDPQFEIVKSAPIPVPHSPYNQQDDSSSLASSPDSYISTFSIGDRSRRASTAASSVTDLIPFSKNASCESLAFSEDTEEIRKLDVALEQELKDENLPTTTDATTIKTETPNPYQNWECGFGFTGKLDAPAAIPGTKAKFLDAVRGEIATVGFVQNGLNSYITAINSGDYHAFSAEFLRDQNGATHKTIGQLFQISRNLEDVAREVACLEGDFSEVKFELREAFAHAQPWVQRTRAILVSAHVFYKINYVLGSDKKKHAG